MTGRQTLEKKVGQLRKIMFLGLCLYTVPALGAFLLPQLSLLTLAGVAVLCAAIVLALEQPRCPACRHKLGSLAIVTPDGKLFGLPPDLAVCPECEFDLDERRGHDGLVEVLSVFEKGGEYYGAVGVPSGKDVLRYELALGGGAHQSMQEIVQMQPFGKERGSGYRYFIVPEDSRRGHAGSPRVMVRVEDGTREEDVRVSLPRSVLRWLDCLQSLEDPGQVLGLKLAGAA